MFIRSKTISGKEYAYLVRTKWDKRSKTVKQKVSKYLGPIIKLDKVKDVDFFDYYNDLDKDDYLNTVSIKQLIRDLVEIELYRHGFTKKSPEKMTNGVIELRLPYVSKVFSLNEGYMNKATLKEIEKYDKILGQNEKKIPYKFAALFVNAGIDIEKELFVEIYQRFFSDSIDVE
ncbi:MAG: hypothetical protein ACLFPQ_05165 [Candidatus Woesearchaeota archaeon]